MPYFGTLILYFNEQPQNTSISPSLANLRISPALHQNNKLLNWTPLNASWMKLTIWRLFWDKDELLYFSLLHIMIMIIILFVIFGFQILQAGIEFISCFFLFFQRKRNFFYFPFSLPWIKNLLNYLINPTNYACLYLNMHPIYKNWTILQIYLSESVQNPST